MEKCRFVNVFAIDQSRSIGIIFVIVVLLFSEKLCNANPFEVLHLVSQILHSLTRRYGASINGHIYCQRFTIVRDGILSHRGFAVVTHYGCVLARMVSRNSPKSVTEKGKKPGSTLKGSSQRRKGKEMPSYFFTTALVFSSMSSPPTRVDVSESSFGDKEFPLTGRYRERTLSCFAAATVYVVEVLIR